MTNFVSMHATGGASRLGVRKSKLAELGREHLAGAFLTTTTGGATGGGTTGTTITSNTKSSEKCKTSTTNCMAGFY